MKLVCTYTGKSWWMNLVSNVLARHFIYIYIVSDKMMITFMRVIWDRFIWVPFVCSCVLQFVYGGIHRNTSPMINDLNWCLPFAEYSDDCKLTMYVFSFKYCFYISSYPIYRPFHNWIFIPVWMSNLLSFSSTYETEVWIISWWNKNWIAGFFKQIF